MNEALTLIYQIYQSFVAWVFSVMLFENVSLGNFFIAIFVFAVLLNFLVAIPRLKVGVHYVKKDDTDS
jgi:hypothetical protein